jgi:SAM-dependent methyltransferase
MTDNIHRELHQSLPTDRPETIKYMARAFRMLHTPEDPHILDIGCGRGGPTLELARLSGGRIIAIDVNQSFLDELTVKAGKAGLSDRITVMNRSMFAMDFENESFDIIWSEGSIFVIGFERGIREWKRFLRPTGFVVAHDMVWLRPDPPHEIRDYWEKIYPGISEVTTIIKRVGDRDYKLIGHFTLPEDVWWKEYYRPLEKRIQKLRKKYAGSSCACAVLDKEQHHVELYKKYSTWYGSAYFIMQKQ